MLAELIKLTKKYNAEVNFRFDDNARALTITMYDRENKYKSCYYISEDDLNYYEDSEAAEKFIMNCIINRIEEDEKIIVESSRLEAVKVNEQKEDSLMRDANSLNTRKYMVEMADEKKVEK